MLNSKDRANIIDCILPELFIINKYNTDFKLSQKNIILKRNLKVQVPYSVQLPFFLNLVSDQKKIFFAEGKK
jgi:hypothetical protein